MSLNSRCVKSTRGICQDWRLGLYNSRHLTISALVIPNQVACKLLVRVRSTLAKELQRLLLKLHSLDKRLQKPTSTVLLARTSCGAITAGKCYQPRRACKEYASKSLEVYGATRLVIPPLEPLEKSRHSELHALDDSDFCKWL